MKRKLFTCLGLGMLLAALMASCAFASTIASSRTSLDGATYAQKNNIDLAIAMLDNTFVEYGETFSFNETVGSRTEEDGYEVAVNGRGVKAIGGGVAQTASTLYLALKKLDGIEYVEKRTYGSKYTGTYVSSSEDAIVTDYKNDIDFSFDNFHCDFCITMWRDSDYIYCSLDTDDCSDDDYYYGGSDYGEEVGFSSILIEGTQSLSDNITLAADSINGYALGHNDVFSFNEIVGPRTEKYGYQKAINGRGVKVIGGGVAQVASAVWMAVKDLDDVDILEKKTYGKNYNQDYVYDEDDAIATDYTNDIDFSFRYTGYDTMVIYTYVDMDELICDIALE